VRSAINRINHSKWLCMQFTLCVNDTNFSQFLDVCRQSRSDPEDCADCLLQTWIKFTANQHIRTALSFTSLSQLNSLHHFVNKATTSDFLTIHQSLWIKTSLWACYLYNIQYVCLYWQFYFNPPFCNSSLYVISLKHLLKITVQHEILQWYTW